MDWQPDCLCRECVFWLHKPGARYGKCSKLTVALKTTKHNGKVQTYQDIHTFPTFGCVFAEKEAE
jgi:hypothetical protein